MKHLDPTQLSAHLDRVLSGRAVQVVEYHLSVCEECRQALAELEAQDRALASAAELDPGDAYFESFADRVESRIRAAEQGAPGARAHRLDRAPEGGLLGWLPATRRLAIVSAAAVVVVGAALVLVTARQSEVPSLRRPELAARDEQVARQASPSTETPHASEGEVPPQGASGWRRSPAVAPLEEKREREQAKQRVNAAEDDRKDTPAAAGDGAARNSQLAAETQSSTATPSSAKSAKSSGASRATKVRARGEGQAQTGPVGFAQPPAPAPAPAKESGKLTKPAPTPLSDAVGQLFKKGSSSSERNAAPLTAAESTAMRGARDVGAQESALLGLDSSSERGRVCGRVVDNRGRAIAGAEAAIAEFGLSTVTGKDGRFCMDVPSGQRTLVVMSIGFETARRAVEVGTGTSEANVTLQTIPVLDTPGKPRAVPRLRVGDPPAIDTFSTWPSALREAARSAQRHHDRAAQLKSVAEFDRAAAEWSRVLPQTRGGPHELLVRERLADARFRAWELGSTPDRSALAIEALTAYVGRAPQGTGRTQAAKRLDRVKQ